MNLAALQDRIGGAHWRIVRGLVLVSLFVLVGKIAGAGKEMAVAYRYGVGEVVDVFVFALALVSWLPLIAASILHSVLVPLTNRLSGDELDDFCAQLTAALLATAIVTSVALMLWLPALSDRLAGGFDAAATADLASVSWLLAPAAGMMLLIALFSSLLLARELHSNTLLEACPSVVVLVWVLLAPDAGYAPLVYGTILGLLVQLVGLCIVLLRSGARLRLSWRFRHRLWKNFRSAVSLMIVGTIAMSMVTPINQFVAARLGEGAVATLSYAIRLLALGVGLGATAIGRSILPVLSDHARPVSERVHLAGQWALGVFVAGLLSMSVAWWLTPWGVELIFERGQFTAADTAAVSHVVRLGLLQVPFFFSGMVLVQLFTSLGQYGLIVYSGVIALVAKAVTAWPLAATMGVAGITLSTALMYCATGLFFAWRLVLLRRSLAVAADGAG